MICHRFFFLLILVSGGSLFSEISQEARELQYSGALLMDRAKLEKAWEIAKEPEIAASLTNAWLFETNIRIDEELLGTPPFLELLSEWEQKEPNNALIPCLRELFTSSRESRFPEWESLGEELDLRSRMGFHYSELRRKSLKFILAKRGNNIKSWIYWFRGTSLQNVERIVQLTHSCLMEARFLIFTGQEKKGRELLEVALRISELIDSKEDEIVLRKLSVTGGVLQEKIIYDLLSDHLSGMKKLISEFRENVEKEKKITARLSVLTGLQQEFTGVFRQTYEEIRPLSWDSVYSVDEESMEKLAHAIYEDGVKAVDGLWAYSEPSLKDFTQDLEKSLDLFGEGEISRADAGRFMDYLRKNIMRKKGMPTWTIPAFARVKKAYPNAVGLGRVTLKEPQKREFRWMLGALSFLTAEKMESSKTVEWIQAFKDGKARPYLLLAFARWKVTDAVPVVLDTFRELSRRAPSNLLLDYAFCLRALTGKDFGLDINKWWQWQLKNKK